MCQSCYGAETADRKCCNTCNDVREAYRIKTWKFDPRGIEQCRDGLTSEIEERALKEGCQIYGYLEVNRVGGSFHIAPGKSFIINHIHVHDVNPFASTDFNVTHKIKHLSFGQHLDLGNRLSSFLKIAKNNWLSSQTTIVTIIYVFGGSAARRLESVSVCFHFFTRDSLLKNRSQG